MARYVCAYCGHSGDQRTVNLEHIIPQHDSHCDHEVNKIKTCSWCNGKKVGKRPSQFREWLKANRGETPPWPDTNRAKLLRRLGMFIKLHPQVRCRDCGHTWKV